MVNGDQVEVAGQRFRYLHACERGREDTQSQAMTQLGESGGEKVGNYLVLPPLLGRFVPFLLSVVFVIYLDKFISIVEPSQLFILD